jgi:hypothetical protein
VALELLESERKYVINISLILKIKATFQGSDGKRNPKERRYRVLIAFAFRLTGFKVSHAQCTTAATLGSLGPRESFQD